MNDMNWTEHLGELRSRIIKSLLALAGAFCLSYFFSEHLMSLVSEPIKPFLTATQGRLIFISPFEKFFSYLWLSLFSAIVLSSPFWFYQIWSFMAPGLYRAEKKGALIFVLSSVILFVSGLLFVYFIVYPFSFRFLLNFGGEDLAYISLKPYLSFFLRSSFIFGMVFELPVLLFLLLKFQIVRPEQLQSARPYVVVGMACLSAFISPPDIFSMLFILIPLYLFFESSLWLSQKFLKKGFTPEE